MIKIINKTNVDPITGTWPFGDIVDDNGTFNGTSVDKIFLTDYVQFFEKMFSESGLVANGLVDNSTNGFQLFEALEDISNEIKLRGARGYTTPGAMLADMTEFSPGLVQFDGLFKVLDFALNAGLGVNIASLGDASPGAEVFIWMNPLSLSIPRFVVNSSTLGSGAIIRKNGVSASDSLFTPTAGTTLHFVRMSTHWQFSVMP